MRSGRAARVRRRRRKLVVNDAEAVRVRRVFELFVESRTESRRSAVCRQRASRQVQKLLDKGDVYKALNLRTYIGRSRTRECLSRRAQAVVPAELWERAHTILQSPAARAAQNRHTRRRS